MTPEKEGKIGRAARLQKLRESSHQGIAKRKFHRTASTGKRLGRKRTVLAKRWIYRKGNVIDCTDGLISREGVYVKRAGGRTKWVVIGGDILNGTWARGDKNKEGVKGTIKAREKGKNGSSKRSY